MVAVLLKVFPLEEVQNLAWTGWSLIREKAGLTLIPTLEVLPVTMGVGVLSTRSQTLKCLRRKRTL